MSTTIHIATDHAGFELKELIKPYLQNKGLNVIDHGPESYIDSDDYPDYIIPAVEAAVAANEAAIVLGGSGTGEALAANKVQGARAALYYGGSEEILRLSREHNNANVLSLGARFLTGMEIKNAIDVWLLAQWSNEDRHIRRLEKISKYESR